MARYFLRGTKVPLKAYVVPYNDDRPEGRNNSAGVGPGEYLAHQLLAAECQLQFL